MIPQFDVPRLTELLKNFYVLTGIRMVVLDDQLVEVAGYPAEHGDFCKVIRSDPCGAARCAQSDRAACLRSRQLGDCHIYRCHAGLTEMVAPIRHENAIVGYMMFGQILKADDKDAYWSVVRGNCAEYALDFDQLKRAYDGKNDLCEPKLRAALQVMEACAGYMWPSRPGTVNEGSISQNIDHFIRNNLSNELSIPMLCQRFSISKTKLNRITKQSFGMSVHEYIRSSRIREAKKLLHSTNLTVGEIAESVGIPDYNYFTKVFKVMEHVTPTDFRNSRGS